MLVAYPKLMSTYMFVPRLYIRICAVHPPYNIYENQTRNSTSSNRGLLIYNVHFRNPTTIFPPTDFLTLCAVPNATVSIAVRFCERISKFQPLPKFEQSSREFVFSLSPYSVTSASPLSIILSLFSSLFWEILIRRDEVRCYAVEYWLFHGSPFTVILSNIARADLTTAL